MIATIHGDRHDALLFFTACNARVDAHALMQCKAARHQLLSKLQPMSRRYGEALFLDAISCRHFRGVTTAQAASSTWSETLSGSA